MTIELETVVVDQRFFYRPDKGGFRVAVRVLKTRYAYGSTHYLIEPIEGVGERWTTDARLSLIPSRVSTVR